MKEVWVMKQEGARKEIEGSYAGPPSDFGNADRRIG
jgi:hypothetical protein